MEALNGNDSIMYTIQYNTIQYNTIQYNTIQYNTIQYNTIQYNTIQYNTVYFRTQYINTDNDVIVQQIGHLCRKGGGRKYKLIYARPRVLVIVETANRSDVIFMNFAIIMYKKA